MRYSMLAINRVSWAVIATTYLEDKLADKIPFRV